jgi:CubicO group peptidase (beta-lactamase class C family)
MVKPWTCVTPAILCLAFAHACMADPSPDTLAPNEVSAVPIPAGQIEAAIGKLDALAQDLMDKTGIPGMSVAVVRDGETAYAKGFGVRKAGEEAAVDADTVFQLASLSKSVGATVVAHQVGIKAAGWDQPVARYMPWFALSDPWVTHNLTVADLYSHRSGLPDHAGDDLEDLGYGQRQILERLRFLPLDPFRSTYAYTNFGVTAAAEAVALAAGTDWATLSEQAMYGPLQMTSTSSRFQDFERRPNRAYGHVKTGGVYRAKYQRQPDAQSPAGGVSASANDMAKWLAMLLGGGTVQGREIVARAALLDAITPQMISAPAASPIARVGTYGYGFNVGVQPSGRTEISHSGAFALGASTAFAVIPSAGIGIVVLSNAAPIGVPETLIAQFTDLVQFGAITRDWRAAYGQVFAHFADPSGKLAGKTPPAHPAAAQAPDVYSGRYGNDYFGDAGVLAEESGLVLTLGLSQKRYPLRHWDGNRFVIDMQGENANEGSISAVDFVVGEGGAACSLRVELLDENGLGTFVRAAGRTGN